MKRIFSCVIVFLCMASFVCAQGLKKDRFDLFLATGYGINVGGLDVGPSTTQNGPGTTPISKEDHYLNYGRGIKIEGGASYKLIEHLYGQFALCYNFGIPGITRTEEVIGSYTLTEKYSFGMFSVKALVKPMFRVFDLLEMYTNFGMGLYFASSSADISRIGINAYTQKAEDSNSPSLGFIGAIGVEYPINESVILYGDIYGEMVSFTMTKTVYSESNPPDLDRINYYQQDVTDRGTPPKTPGTNVAIRVGVKFPIF